MLVLARAVAGEQPALAVGPIAAVVATAAVVVAATVAAVPVGRHSTLCLSHL